MPTVLMVFVDTATLCLKRWGVIIIFAHVNKLAILSLRKKVGETKKDRARLDELRKQYVEGKG